jgi:glycosyltransferase involved in cell wall biosynthesis
MKILILVSMFPPAHIGGTEIAARNIAKFLVRNGHSVSVVTSRDKESSVDTLEDGFWVKRVGYPKIKFLGLLFFWIKYLLFVNKNRPDIIHAQGAQMGFPAFLSKKLFGIPYVVYCRGSDVYYPWAFKKSFLKTSLGSAGLVISLTEDMKKDIRKYSDAIVEVVPNGINLDNFVKLEKKSDGENILFVGSLKHIKGLKYLVQAFKKINNSDTKTKLFLVGDGEERKNLEALVIENKLEGKVEFVGKVENDEILKYMAIADVFVLPSLSEGFPMVILEAMSSGLPIVASNVRGLGEIIKDEENGFLVEPKNVNQIVEKVLLLLENYKLREKIANNNMEKVKRYSWVNVVGKIEKIYLEAVVKNNKK